MVVVTGGLVAYETLSDAPCTPIYGTKAPVDPQLVTGNTAFAFKLYQAIPKDIVSNLIYSPYSIAQALAMLDSGADGQTETQIASALNRTLPQPQYASGFQALNTDLARNVQDPVGTWCNASALWIDRTYSVNPDYLNQIKGTFNSDVQSVDFKTNASGAANQISQWINNQTRGRIANFRPQLDPNTRLILANATYFKNKWDKPFTPSATAPGPFTLLNEQSISVPMMHMHAYYTYGETDDPQFLMIDLPYQGQHVSMVILMPNNGQFEIVEASLSGAQFDAALSSMSSLRVDLSMPRFQFQYNLPLIAPLTALGITDAFDPKRANFAKMYSPGSDPLYVGEALHRAWISTGEDGTEAAGASVFSQIVGSAPIKRQPREITIDHPFIFAIRDDQTGTILFLGRVMNPLAG